MSSSQQPDYDNMCNTCLVEGGPFTLTYCNHKFHLECFETWYFEHASSSCPMCRHQFPTCEFRKVEHSQDLAQIPVPARQAIQNPAPRPWIHTPYRHPHYYRFGDYYVDQTGGYSQPDEIETVASLFNYRANVRINYPFRFSTLENAEWHITASGGNWLPASWDAVYRRRRGETREALEVIRNGGYADLRVTGGLRPRRLFLCRSCRNAVFATAHDRRTHELIDAEIEIREEFNRIRERVAREDIQQRLESLLNEDITFD